MAGVAMSWQDAIDRARSIMREDHEAAIEQSRDSAEALFDIMAARCDSPIEVLMLGALAYGLNRCTDTRQLSYPAFCSRGKFAEGVHLRAQEKIGPYRVDFALSYVAQHSEGVFTKVDVVIECDGHEYHNITKEQAQRDRERDRYLQQCGWAVLRFTGSEIFRDPQACADQVADFLAESSHRVASGELEVSGG